MIPPDRETCPACGGSGGGPFGRAGSAWDVETYECVRCGGWGYIREASEVDEAPPAVVRPGIAKASPERTATEESERRSAAQGDRQRKR
jgi:hypothetical protein